MIERRAPISGTHLMLDILIIALLFAGCGFLATIVIGGAVLWDRECRP